MPNQTSETELVSLESVCHFITDGKHGDCVNEERSGYYFLSAKDVKDGKLNYDGARQITKDDYFQTHKRTQLEPLDILISNSGTIGRMAIAQDTELTRRTTFQKSVAILKPNKERVYPYWLLYYLYSVREKLINTAGGTAQVNLLLRDLRSFPVNLPSLPTQRRIADVLSAYDDLIEVNTRRIRILERLAQSMYWEWFGKVEAESLPEGWEVKTLDQVSKNFDSKRVPLSSMKRAEMQGDYPYYGAAKVLDHVNDYIFDGKFLLIAEDGSVITTDGKPVLQMAYGKFWVNNHTHILQGIDPISTEYLYLRLCNLDIVGYITGAAQPKITQANLNRITVLVPPKEILAKFNEVALNLFNQMEILQQKNANLRKTRDLLLPRLVGGEIPVHE